MATVSLINNDKLSLDKGIFRRWNLVIVMAFVGIVFISYADQTSLFSYAYSLLLLIASSMIICKKQVKDLLFAYHFYLFFSIAFYLIFKSQFPECLGMTGADSYFGIQGLDDRRFYAQIVDGDVPYTLSGSIIQSPYSILLKNLYPFTVFTPLNIVIVCLIFTAYLPIYTKRLANQISLDNKVGSYAFWYSLLCPFTLFFGCIILRESFTATMVLAGLCYFIEKKHLPLIVCVVAIGWIRLGTLAFLICGILLLSRFKLKQKLKTDIYFIVLIVLVIYIFYVSIPYLQMFSGGKLEEGIIRSTDSERYENTSIGAIMALPFPINIILSTIFFFFIPLLSLPQKVEGYYLVGNIFQGFLTPIFMFFLWKYIFNASIVAFYYKNKGAAREILFMALLFAMLLGVISMQSRHKTVLFPILCILAAYGKVNYDKRCNFLSVLLALIVIGSQFLLVLA